MTTPLKLVGATDTPPEGVDREIMVTESFLISIEDTLRESMERLIDVYRNTNCSIDQIWQIMAYNIAAHREIIEAIKTVREL